MTVLSTIWLHSLLIKSFLGDIKYFWPIFNNYWWLTTANIPSFTRYKRCIAADKQSNRAGLVHKFVTSPSIQTAPNAIHFYLLCCSTINLSFPSQQRSRAIFVGGWTVPSFSVLFRSHRQPCYGQQRGPDVVQTLLCVHVVGGERGLQTSQAGQPGRQRVHVTSPRYQLVLNSRQPIACLDPFLFATLIIIYLN